MRTTSSRGRGHHQREPSGGSSPPWPPPRPQLEGKPLLVDTGDADLDRALGGHIRVISGYREQMIYRLQG